MAVKRNPYVKFQCNACKHLNYFLHKSKEASEKKLELKKFCRSCKKHGAHKETKK